MNEEPVVILTGPRTVGKSTLLAALAAQFDRPVLDLDRPDARAAAASDPAFMVSGPGPVLIDEFQHVPEILDAIKAELNTDTRPGRYVLTGSTRYPVLPQAAQSLTGRAHVINVLPLFQGELHGRRGNFIDRLWADPDRRVPQGARHRLGLAGWLLGLSAAKISSRDPAVLTEFGHLVETFAAGEILKQVSWSEEAVTAAYFRTQDGPRLILFSRPGTAASPGSKSRPDPASRTLT
jgi:predicted AAA+ superfamily ATPase